ncbi:hypothetical protein IAR55_003360 [Kwoniella newhampshirensis]|uniref:C2 domain-containing protein n=1 Tax=Kwoniella newhampshirensis TaxID=1651941 RepID=A0AAW0YQP7_9TREE
MGSTAIEPKELGTLIVVVGKAKNLPNKSRFGKQDPFCTVAVGEEKQRTKPIKRGGQHPEWDEELRFAIFEDLDDVLVRSESQPDSLTSSLNGAPPPLPKDTPAGVITSAALASKSRKGPLGKKGGLKSMRVACYADDPKEPELIGECVINIEEALKKGEVDEWYEFTHKEKYSGEIYLEMTFYSNDAPPVRRNVPRPAIHNSYGSTGAFTASPSSTLSSLASKTRLPGALNASGSVSGLSLYIPPYVQAQQGESALPPAQVPPSNSFAELGLPPDHRLNHTLPQPGQPAYPPGQSPNQALLGSQASIDALTRPMSSMSLGTSFSSRPLSSTPAPSSQSSVGHAYGAHRHSVGGHSEAPWGPILSQSQPVPAPTPHPRPMSTSDAIAWDQGQHSDVERLRAAATPVPRPSSGQGYISHPGPSYTPVPRHSYQSTDSRAPSPIPPSLRPAGPPHPTLQHHPYSAAPEIPISYPNPSPTPAPPPPSASEPPISPSTLAHYQLPTSSFSSLTQPVADLRRASSPGPGLHPAHSGGSYQPHNHTISAPQRAYDATPLRSNSYPVSQDYQQMPPVPGHSQPTYGSTYPPQQQSQPNHQPLPHQNHHAYSQASQPPVRQPSPAPPQPLGADEGYVPWYQQTQSARPPSQPPYRQDEYGQPSQRPQYGSQLPPSHYTSTPAPPPPVPERRPGQQPPPPPKPQAVGYYPSDELYAQHRQDTGTPQLNGWHPNHQSRPSYDSGVVPYGSQHFTASAGQPSSSTFSPPPHQYQAPYQPAPSPPRQQSWQTSSQASNYGGPQNGHGQPTSSQLPPLPNHGSSNYYDSAPPHTQDAYHRAATPQPPTNPYRQSPSPQPPVQNPYQRSASPQPGYDRGPSPQPPLPMHSYQPAHSKDPWQQQQKQQQQQQQFTGPDLSHSPLPDPYRAPSPSPLHQTSSGTGVAKGDWKSYMASLGTGGHVGAGGSMPNRTPSPQPPPKDQGQWFTPPPSLPASIAPPEGWRSTLPAQTDGHAWRG